MRERLISTGDAVIAECARKDRIWGIGLGMDDPFVLGSAIFSEWRYFTHWADGPMEPEDIRWFQLAEIFPHGLLDSSARGGHLLAYLALLVQTVVVGVAEAEIGFEVRYGLVLGELVDVGGHVSAFLSLAWHPSGGWSASFFRN